MEMRGRWCVWVLMAGQVLAFGQAEQGAQPPMGGEAPPARGQIAQSSAAPGSADAVKSSISETKASLSNGQIRELIRQVAEKDLENDKRQRDYTYLQRSEEHKLNGKGGVTSTEIKTYEVMQIYGEGVERLIAKDDKPLPEKEAAKEEEKIQKIIDKRKDESDSDREKRLKKEEKEREDGREFVKEVADAYNFTLAGVENLDGREAYAIDAKPRPGYEPHHRDAKFLPKFRFRIWIDREESQWVKLEAECIDTVSIGLFLARIHKGSKILIETTRVNDEVWLPKHVAVHVDGRLALLKGFNIEQDVTYKDYKKFHTATRIVGMGETK
jgi:hypothetical protein